MAIKKTNNEGAHFRCEVRRWFDLWKNENPNSKQKRDTARALSNSKSAYTVENTPGGFC